MSQTDRWYVLSNFGRATLCADEDDARKFAAQYDVDYPRGGPHIATRMRPWSGKPPCGRECEATAFEVEIRRLLSLLRGALPYIEASPNPEPNNRMDRVVGPIRAALAEWDKRATL